MAGKFVRLVDIASRGGKVPPLYLFLAYILPGALYYRTLTGNIKIIPFILISTSIIPLMAATNLFDDYFDFKNGFDSDKSPNTRYRKHPIFYYGVSSSFLLLWAIVASAVYFSLSVITAYLYGLPLLIIAVAGFTIGYGYTGPPLGLKYKALGEFTVALSTILISLMIFYSESGIFSINVIIFALPYSVILMPVLFLGNFRDVKYDMLYGIKTLPIILGRRLSSVFIPLIFFIYYVLVITYSLFKIYSMISILSLITVPVSFYGIRKWMELPDTKYENFIGNIIFLNTMVLSALLFI